MNRPRLFLEERLQQALRSDDCQLHHRVLTLFMDNLNELAESLTTTPISSEQWQKLRSSAHRHKSPAESVGSEQLAETLGALEQAIDCDQFTHAASILETLPDLVNQTKDVIHKKIGQLEQRL